MQSLGPTGTSSMTDNRDPSFGLTIRAAIGTAAILLVVVIAVLSVVAIGANRAANDTAKSNLDQSADLVSQLLTRRERTLIGGARVFVQYSPFRATISGGPREDVLDQAIGAVDQIAADWVFITDDEGVLIAKSDEPAVHGNPMGQFPLVAGALGGHEQGGFGASGDTMLFQAVALPIKADLGAPAGVLVATLVVDSVFLHDVKVQTSSDLLFFTRDSAGREHPAASTVPGSARDLAAFLASRGSSTGKSVHVATLGQERYMWMGTPLITAGGNVIGGFLVMRRQNNAAAAFVALRTPIVIALIVGSLAVLVASYLVSRFVARPLRQLASAVAGVADGAAAPDVPYDNATGVRELSNLSGAFHALLSDSRDKQALIAASRFVPVRKMAAGEPSAPERLGRASRNIPRGSAAPSVIARHITRPGLVLDAGTILANRYFIQAEVGRGGLGIVYRALDRVLGEVVAIKVLRPELALAAGGGFEQLKRELRITRRLSHRNIVRTYDIGETEEAPFLTMEYVDGASLATVIASRGPLSRDATLAMAKQMFGALSVAHEHGIVHGDLKPQNLLIEASGLLKVTDFGVARLIRSSKVLHNKSEVSAGPSRSDARLTGAVIGTPEYMAPEQLIGEPSSLKSDLYAAGVVLKECVTGSTPYQADTPVEFVARKHGSDTEQQTDAGISLSNRSNEPGMKEIVLLIDCLTNPRPELRPASARETYAHFAQLG